MEEGLRRRAAGYGLPYGRSDILSNSRAAIEAAEYAREEGRFEPFHREVFAAYFARGMDIGDVDVLTGLAETAGLDAGGLREALDAGRYAGRREEVAGEAARLGSVAFPHSSLPEAPEWLARSPWRNSEMPPVSARRRDGSALGTLIGAPVAALTTAGTLPSEGKRREVASHLLQVVALEGRLHVMGPASLAQGVAVPRRQEGVGLDVEGAVAGVGDAGCRQG